jgi:hypothetical protein
MLTKNTIIDKIEVVGEYKYVQVRQATVISENDVELSRSYNRWVIAPGDDYSTQSKEVKDICKTVHTPQVIEAYQNRPRLL